MTWCHGVCARVKTRVCTNVEMCTQASFPCVCVRALIICNSKKPQTVGQQLPTCLGVRRQIRHNF